MAAVTFSCDDEGDIDNFLSLLDRIDQVHREDERHRSLNATEQSMEQVLTQYRNRGVPDLVVGWLMGYYLAVAFCPEAGEVMYDSLPAEIAATLRRMPERMPRPEV